MHACSIDIYLLLFCILYGRLIIDSDQSNHLFMFTMAIHYYRDSLDAIPIVATQLCT